MFLVPFIIGLVIGKCYVKWDKHRSRLDKEISDTFNKYKE